MSRTLLERASCHCCCFRHVLFSLPVCSTCRAKKKLHYAPPHLLDSSLQLAHLKGRIATTGDLPTKILYAMEIRIQHWLAEWQKFSNRSMVNDRLVSFDEIFEMVMNSSRNVILPPNFIKPLPRTHRPNPTPRRGTTASKRERERKGNWTKPLEIASSRMPPPREGCLAIEDILKGALQPCWNP